METLKGNNIEYDFSQFKKIADLIYYEGPLLSHYKSPRGEDYLFYWTDVNEEFNRWMIVRVDSRSLQKYLEKKIPLRELVSNPNDGFVYFADIDNDIKYHNIKIVLAKDIPEEYIPSEESFYNFEEDYLSESIQQPDAQNEASGDDSSNSSEVTVIESVGRFYSINTKTESYAFESTEGEKFNSSGRIDDSLNDLLYELSFNKAYRVVITRFSIGRTGKIRDYKDVIVSYSELKANL
jgi:hypothetical protein